MNKQQKQQLEVLREYRKEVIQKRKDMFKSICFFILTILLFLFLGAIIGSSFGDLYDLIYEKGYDAGFNIGFNQGKSYNFNQIYESLKDYDCEGNITFRNNQSEEIKLKKLDCPKLIVMNTTDSVFRIGSRGILK